MPNESSLSPDVRRDAPHEIERENLLPQVELGRSLFAVECVASVGDGARSPDGQTPDCAQRGLLEALESGMTLVFEFTCVAATGGIPSWYVGAYADHSRASHHDHAARAAIVAAIEDPRVGFMFQQAGAQRATEQAKFSVALRPALESLGKANHRRLIGFGPQCIGGLVVQIPRMPPLRGGEMDALLAVLAQADTPVRVRCMLRRVAVPLALVRRVSPDRKRLSPGVVSWLEAAGDNPTTIQLDARLLSDAAIDPDLAARAGHCLFGTSPRSGDPEPGGLDDHPSGFHEDLWVPTLLPSPQSLNAQGLPALVIPGALTLSNRGVVLGRVPGSPGRLVRLPDEDRSRHCYAIGGTGSGKSTLLLRMLEADMRAGHGVCLIDPHGDLFEEALRRVPASRAHDVVLIDPYDEERSVGLNMLQSCGSRPDIAATLVSNSLVAIFDRLYDLEKTGGPIFESYLRNAVLLVLAGDLSATIVDVVRVFEDSSYRQCLIELCPDSSVTSFWIDQAQKAGGDASLRNVAPYVTSKLNQFTNNHLIRPIVAQSTSTIRFDALLSKLAADGMKEGSLASA